MALVDELAWMRDAACTGEPLRWFFPRRGDMALQALECCAACPVRQPCLAHALAQGHGPERVIGVWGGTSDNERRKIPRVCADCRTPLAPEARACYHLDAIPAHRWLCSRCRAAERAREAALEVKRNWHPGAETYARRWVR